MLINNEGQIVAWAEGAGTNFYVSSASVGFSLEPLAFKMSRFQLTPFQECQKIIEKLAADAFQSANLPVDTKLKSLASQNFYCLG